MGVRGGGGGWLLSPLFPSGYASSVSLTMSLNFLHFYCRYLRIYLSTYCVWRPIYFFVSIHACAIALSLLYYLYRCVCLNSFIVIRSKSEMLNASLPDYKYIPLCFSSVLSLSPCLSLSLTISPANASSWNRREIVFNDEEETLFVSLDPERVFFLSAMSVECGGPQRNVWMKFSLYQLATC